MNGRVLIRQMIERLEMIEEMADPNIDLERLRVLTETLQGTEGSNDYVQQYWSYGADGQVTLLLAGFFHVSPQAYEAITELPGGLAENTLAILRILLRKQSVSELNDFRRELKPPNGPSVH